MGALPGAPVADRLPARNRLDPPIWLMTDGVNCTKAPVAWSDGDQVLPMLSTSGPLPDTVAAVIWVSSVVHGITWKLTLMPVCLVNLAICGPSTCWSSARLVPWLLAQ